MSPRFLLLTLLAAFGLAVLFATLTTVRPAHPNVRDHATTAPGLSGPDTRYADVTFVPPSLSRLKPHGDARMPTV